MNAQEAIKGLNRLHALKPGWYNMGNGSEGEAIKPEAIALTERIALMFPAHACAFPRLDGGVAVEWDDGTNIYEVIVSADLRIDFSRLDSADRQHNCEHVFDSVEALQKSLLAHVIMPRGSL